MGFSRQEYWSGLPFSSPGHLPYPGIKSKFSALQADSLPSEPPGKPLLLGKISLHTFRNISNVCRLIFFLYIKKNSENINAKTCLYVSLTLEVLKCKILKTGARYLMFPSSAVFSLVLRLLKGMTVAELVSPSELVLSADRLRWRVDVLEFSGIPPQEETISNRHFISRLSCV